MGTFRDLIVYKKAFQLAMEIFEMTKTFPKEEKFSLIDQIEEAQDRCVRISGKATEKEDI